MRAKICLFLLSMANVIIVAESLSILDPILQAIFGPPPLPEEKMTVPETIKYHGYPVEVHSVTTDDGYILEMHRIPHGKDDSNANTKRQPVLFQHGLMGDDTMWVWNTPDKNLAYKMADAGYDVFLGNFRGTKYSQKHKILKSTDKQFWNFSYDEFVKYDIPAQINYILKVTGFTQIQYTGHSLGTTTILALLATQPEFNEKVKVVAALAPVATYKNMKSPIRLLSLVDNPLSAILKSTDNGKLNLNDDAARFLLTEGCRIPLAQGVVCNNILFAIAGPDQKQMNTSRVPLYNHFFPASTSVKTFQHYLQGLNSGKFAKFDYGVRNQEMYNQPTPPEYDLPAITAPIALFWGENDWLTVPEDVAKIGPKLQNMVLNHRVNWTDWSHFDFIYAIDADSLLNTFVLELHNKYK